MAVPEQIPVVNYVADGIVKKFDVPFEYDQQSDLHVYVDGVEPTIDKYYFDGNAFNFYIAPTSGQDVKIKRITPKERDTDYNLHTNTVRPKALNTDFDRLWYVLQEVFSDVGGLSQTVQDEIIARIQGDEDLLNQLTAEISARMLGDEAVTEDLKNYVNNMIALIIGDPSFNGIDADKVNDASGETQQQVNYNGGSKWHLRVGGYKLNERVVLTNGDIVKSTADGNVTDPNVDMTGWVKDNSASQIFTSDGINLDVLSNLYRTNFVFITDPLFGATGDGSDESAKVQAALDYVGEYGTIYVPRGTFFTPQGLQLKRGQTIQGFGAQSSILQGDGTSVVIKTNAAISGTVRYLRLLSVGVDNFTRAATGGNYAVQWWAANDSHIQFCEFKAKAAEALHVKYSYRGSITKNRITSSGSSFAFALLNNCNGMDCSNNTVSGGGAGSGVRVGMSQTINLMNTVVEVAGGVAVRVGGDDGADGGRCTGINLKGLYAEQTKRVLEAGLFFECYGIDIDGFMINQKSVSVIATYDEALHLGRVNGLFFQSGFAEGANQTAFIKLYDKAAGAGWTPYLSGSTLKSKAVTGYTGNFSFDGSTQSFSPRIFGRNLIAINSDETIGAEQEYISSPIVCNVGYTNKIIIPPSSYGGMIQSVEIIEANASTGGISGTINIGSSVSATEVYTSDLSTVTLTNGYAKVVLESAAKFIRSTGLVMAVSAGTHTSTFRVRIKYRV